MGTRDFLCTSPSRSHRGTTLCQGDTGLCCDGNGGSYSPVCASDEGRASDLPSRSPPQIFCGCAQQGASRGLVPVTIVQRGHPAAPSGRWISCPAISAIAAEILILESQLPVYREALAAAVFGGGPSSTDGGSGLSSAGLSVPE